MLYCGVISANINVVFLRMKKKKNLNVFVEQIFKFCCRAFVDGYVLKGKNTNGPTFQKFITYSNLV